MFCSVIFIHEFQSRIARIVSMNETSIRSRHYQMKKVLLSVCLGFISQLAFAQSSVVYSKFTTKENRTKFNAQLFHTIKDGLAIPLSDSTEESWEDAFNSAELIDYHDALVVRKAKAAFTDIDKRSIEFQRSLLELLYTLRISGFQKDVTALFNQSFNTKVIAMCVEYLMLMDPSPKNIASIEAMMHAKIQTLGSTKLVDTLPGFAIYQELTSHINSLSAHPSSKIYNLKPLFDRKYLKGNTVIYSIQRKNRNYPGILIIKDTTGNFYIDETGKIFSIPQLARSVSNLPYYLTNGNTPQGLFRMDGFDVSKSNFIGPTQNIQLTMPFENSVQHFLKDSSVKDTSWKLSLYQSLLPPSLREAENLMETFYASMAGRTEIIAHGTTVDPEFYKGQLYYPFTPTAGCLCTKEIWYANGTRAISDQQRLVDAVKKAGGADGYVIVLELDDAQRPVVLTDVLPFLK